MFRSRWPQEILASILHHVAENNGVRKTERLAGVHRDTATRYSRLAGSHAKDLHDELVALYPPDS